MTCFRTEKSQKGCMYISNCAIVLKNQSIDEIIMTKLHVIPNFCKQELGF